MLKQSEILLAVGNKLKSQFPNFPAYLDDTKENFKSPCFFLKMIVLKQPVNKYVNYNDCTLYITYFSLKGEAMYKTYDIKDAVIDLFWRGLKVKDRYIHFGNISTMTEGQDADIEMLTLPFVFYDAIEMDVTEYLMMNFYNRQKG